LFWAGRLALFCAEWQRAARLLGDSAELAGTVGDPLVQALAIGKRAWVLVETGNVDAGIGQSEAALALARKSGDSWTIAETLNDAALCNERTNPKRAIELIAESLALRRTLGDVLNIVDSLNNLGYVSANEGDSETAQQHLQEGLRLAREIGDFRHIVLIVGNLGNVGLFGGDYETAAEHYRECLRVSRRIGDRRIPLEAMRGLAAIATVNGDIERAAVLSAAATSLHREFGGTLSSAEIAMEERFFDPARARVGSAIWDGAAEGAAEMSLDAAVALALTDSRMSLPATNR
jgi:tetratricopeptide (TPR) repeat protein